MWSIWIERKIVINRKVYVESFGYYIVRILLVIGDIDLRINYYLYFKKLL